MDKDEMIEDILSLYESLPEPGQAVICEVLEEIESMEENLEVVRPG